MSQTFLEEVSRVVVLRRKGRAGMLGLCPFHRERTPSFYIDTEHDTFHCFGCGMRGTREEFTAHLAQRGLTPLSAIVVPPRAMKWGPWRFDAAAFELFGPHSYAIDLERCTDSANVLDWILQIARKDWATDEVLAHLVRALDAIFDLQRTMCADGVDTRIDPYAVEKSTRG